MNKIKTELDALIASTDYPQTRKKWNLILNGLIQLSFTIGDRDEFPLSYKTFTELFGRECKLSLEHSSFLNKCFTKIPTPKECKQVTRYTVTEEFKLFIREAEDMSRIKCNFKLDSNKDIWWNPNIDETITAVFKGVVSKDSPHKNDGVIELFYNNKLVYCWMNAVLKYHFKNIEPDTKVDITFRGINSKNFKQYDVHNQALHIQF